MRNQLVALLLASFPAFAIQGEPPTGPGPDRPAALDVVFARALARAAEKLESPGCRLVLQDFRDGSGRTLDERLSETGLSASSYIESLAFRNGRAESPCRVSGVQAFTSVGGSIVWVCPRRSRGFAAADVPGGSSALIHEMLHTLGLSENPPTSLEITERVIARCGR